MSPNSVSAVLEKLIRRLCLGDFPCRRVGLHFWLFCLSNGIRRGNCGQMIALSQETERGWRRRSSGGGGSGSPGSAEMSSLSVASGSLMESSSCFLERAGCARSWTPPRQPGVHPLHHTTYHGKGCERLSFQGFLFLLPPIWCVWEQVGRVTGNSTLWMWSFWI